MYVLNKLWRGEVQPAEYNSFTDAESKELLQQLSHHRDQLLLLLNSEQKMLFEQFTDIETQLVSIEEENCFCQGFKLADQLIMDGVSES